MKTQALARDSLKLQKSQMFTVLYDLILYVAMPIAFELSFVKIFEKSMSAYHVNDVLALSRLAVYFIVQFILGVMVRKGYVNVTLKRLTLALMILILVKEAFFDEVLFDMILSMMMESGMMVLLFFKFTQLVVLLKLVGLSWLIMGSILYTISYLTNRNGLNDVFDNILAKLAVMFRIRNCHMHSYWVMPCHS